MSNIIEIDCATGEVTERPMTEAELADRQAAAEAYAAEQAAREAAEAEKAAKKDAVLAALAAAAGLSVDEVKDVLA